MRANGQTAEYQPQIDELVDRERARHADVERKLADATDALHEAEQRYLTAMGAFANQLAADRESRHALAAAQAAAVREMIDEQLRAAAIEVDRARQNQAAAAAEVERLGRRESELAARLTEAIADGEALGRRLADAEASLEAANACAARERLAADELVQRKRKLLAQIVDDAGRRREVEQLLARAVRARDDAEAQRQSAMADAAAHCADVERLAKREVELGSMLADARTSHGDLERRLAAAEGALRDADARARELPQVVADRDRLTEQLTEAEGALDRVRCNHESAVADVSRLAEREQSLTSQLADVQAVRHALEVQLADASAALIDAQQRHDAAQATAAAEQAGRQAEFERERSEAAADRNRLTEQLNEAAAALDAVRRNYDAAAADVSHLTEREGALTSQLAEVQAGRHALEVQLADTSTALSHAQQRHDAAAKAAAADLDGLTGRLNEAELLLDQVRRDHESALSDVSRLTEREASLASRLAEVDAARDALGNQLAEAQRVIADAASREADLDRQLEEERAERSQSAAALDRVTRRLNEVEAALEQALRDHHSAATDVTRLTQCEADLTFRLACVNADLTELQGTHQRLEAHLAETLAAKRDADERAASDRTAANEIQAALERARTELQERLAATAGELESTRRRRDALQVQADKVPGLLKQSDERFAESRRLFQQMPMPMFRCGPSGALIDANRAGLGLVGHRAIDDLRGARFASAVFEDPNAHAWLVERCLRTRTKESIETVWRQKSGSRLVVRLSAYAASTDVIEMAAEDLTRVRVLQERLGQAQKTEAVGRLAPEIAVTCGNLLDNVHRTVQEWLMEADGQAPSHHHQVLDDLARAAGFLQQLAGSGAEPAAGPALADLGTVIRDLQPVLARVAGDVEVEVLDTPSPLNIAAGTDRIERLLVNLASYGRERMPAGGQLRIELDTTVVDRHFAAKHPNVRLGRHALITVTKRRRGDDAARGRTGHTGGVDLGTLQELVSECGGHLWMTLQPAGDMVAKIRLPLLTSYDQATLRPSIVPPARERTLARWFQRS